MLSPDGPRSFLASLAPHSADTWMALGPAMFPGELSMATMSGVYRFKNGIFLGRANLSARTFEWAKAMRGTRLIGFLADERGLWALSPRWREGTHAVLWKPDATDGEPFLITSPTTSFTLEEAESAPEPRRTSMPSASDEAPPESGVRTRRAARPPSIRRPLPPSTTRIHPALPSQSTR